MAIDVAIAPPIVEINFKDIRPPEALVDRWAVLKARGVGWKERHVKHARLEIDGVGPPNNGITTEAVPLGRDVWMTAPLRPVRAGDEMKFQIVRDSPSMPDFDVGLRSVLSAAGIRLRPYAQGRVRQAPSLAARSVLPGVNLRPSADRPDERANRFVMPIFDVQPEQRAGAGLSKGVRRRRTEAARCGGAARRRRAGRARP